MALATADIHVKIDPMIKKRAERKLKQAGITMSEFINLELRRVVREEQKVENVVDVALPENLRINTEQELIDFLERRVKQHEANRGSFTIEQVEEKLRRGELEVIK